MLVPSVTCPRIGTAHLWPGVLRRGHLPLRFVRLPAETRRAWWNESPTDQERRSAGQRAVRSVRPCASPSSSLSYGHKREHVLAIENAKKPETRLRRIEKALAMLRDQEPAGSRAARAKTPGDHS